MITRWSNLFLMGCPRSGAINSKHQDLRLKIKQSRNLFAISGSKRAMLAASSLKTKMRGARKASQSFAVMQTVLPRKAR